MKLERYSIIGAIMSFDTLIKDIKKIYYSLHSKDVDVILTYKGTSYGVVKPYHLRCDAAEVNALTHEQAAQELFDKLKDELKTRIISNESSLLELKKTLNLIEAN